MSVAIVGAGAIGCSLASLLHDAGHSPLLCVRSGFDELVVERPSGRAAYPPQLAFEPADLGAPRWVLLATKAHQTASAAPWLRAAASAGAPRP